MGQEIADRWTARPSTLRREAEEQADRILSRAGVNGGEPEDGNDSPDCRHLDEYRIGGECLRCEQAFNTRAERESLQGTIG